MSKFTQNMKPILGDLKKFSLYEKEGLIDRKTFLKYIKEYESEEAWLGYRLKGRGVAQKDGDSETD